MEIRLTAALAFVIFLSSGSSPAQHASFILSTDTLSRSYVPTYLGNGTIGVASSQTGIAATRSYMAWIFDHPPHDVARIASLPAWNALDLSDGKRWLSSATEHGGTFQQYRQALNMYDGILETSYIWNDGGRKTRVAVSLMASRANPHIAAVKLTIQPQYSGLVRISLPLRQWPPPDRMPLADDARIQVKDVNGIPDVWYPGHMGTRARGARVDAKSGAVWIEARADSSMSVAALVAQIRWSANVAGPNVTSDTGSNDPVVMVAFPARSGKKYSFEKLVAIVSSHDTTDPLALARSLASSASEQGFDALQRENARAWHDLWKTDIIVRGNPDLQKAIHSTMFYLLGSAGEGTDFALPPMGLSSDGYYGHVFWDSDTWMFPPLLLTHPTIARSLVMFRYHALAAARANAQSNGHSGAMYPWESDEVGNEATPRFACQNALLENHVTGDVAFAQWQYFLATADTPWLATFGLPVIEATADFWAHRARYDSAKDRYSIDSVVSVDEGLVGVSNDSYTNAVARRNLEIATKACRLTGHQADPLWSRVASRLLILIDSTRRVHRPYQNAPDSVIGGVAPLLVYPLEYSPSNDIAQNDLRNAFQLEERHGGGAMMTVMLYPVVAAQLGDKDLFDRFLRISYRRWMRGSFNVFSETPRNMSTNFLTGAGAFLQQVLFGYTGLRIIEEGLKAAFPPMLPQGVTEMTITSVPFRGRVYDVSVRNGTTRIVGK